MVGVSFVVGMLIEFETTCDPLECLLMNGFHASLVALHVLATPLNCHMCSGKMHGKFWALKRFRSGRPIRHLLSMSGDKRKSISKAWSSNVTRSVAVPAFFIPDPLAAMMFTLSLPWILAPSFVASIGEQILLADAVSGQAEILVLTLLFFRFSARLFPSVTVMLSSSGQNSASWADVVF